LILGGSVLGLSKSGEVASVVWSYLPSYTLYLSLTATPLFLLVAVAIGLEYMLSTAVSRGCCRAIVAQSVFCSLSASGVGQWCSRSSSQSFCYS